jgi:hypothetical protein
VTPPSNPLGMPTVPQPPSIADLSDPLLQALTGRPYGPMTTQDATPTNLSNALQQILILPAPR